VFELTGVFWYDFRKLIRMSYRKATDRYGLYSTHEPEIRDMAKKLKYSIDEILSAVQEVGFDEAAIEEYIRDRNDRSF